ncbi:MAG: ABC transporter ATP-binding protein [Candidatus Zipacnadales bacterium]
MTDPSSGLPAAAWPQPSIVVRGLTKRFGEHVAVDNLNLTVMPGEFFGFLGPNGAGKTTTIRMMVGLLRPDAGEVIIGGHNLMTDPLGLKGAIGLLPEELNLYERLTGREFIEFAGTMYGLDREQVRRRTEELLGLMELEEHANKMIVDYSAGMKKKTAMAAALIHNPPVLFLDEPFSGIDAVSSRAIRGVLDRLRTRGTTIFFSSHILDLAERLCTRIAILHLGQLRAVGTLSHLRAGSGLPPDSTLEDVFLALIGAPPEKDELSWIA